MNRAEELKSALLGALNTPSGTVYKVIGDQPNQRQLAMSALITAKRELLPDNPEMINIRIQFIPGNPDEIAIVYLRPINGG